MSTDDLTQAAERAKEMWPGPIGEAASAWLLAEVQCHEAVPEVADAAERLFDSLSGEPGSAKASLTISTLGAATDFARAILAASAPAVDRETLIEIGHDAVDWDRTVTADRVRSTRIVAQVVDAFLSRGLVTGTTAEGDGRG